MAEFSDRVVIVTGACGGIGEAIARRFAASGAMLGLCDIRDYNLDSLASALSADGTRVHHAPTDVTDPDSVRTFCDDTAAALGKIDHLINTVGVVDNLGDVVDLPIETWDRTLAVNLTSAFLTASSPFLILLQLVADRS